MTIATEQFHIDQTPRPSAPTFASLEEERQHRKRQLAAAYRIFAKYEFDEGAAGHISARDPELKDHFWMNSMSVPFAHVKVSDLQLINFDGYIVEGHEPMNAAGFAIHSQILAENPEIVSAAHSHSMHGKAWSSLGRPLDPITQDACHFYNLQALLNEYSGVVLDLSEGKRIAELAKGKKLVILQNHGMVTVGRGVDEACWLHIAAERSCQAQLLAEAAGDPIFVPEEIAQEIGQWRAFGGRGFDSYYKCIVAEHPELLD
jgi:ribulose-5-phosphate 4-epimerase/fuculose-1-phosphate aldolase